jgi:mRNA-degrading endonuclease toxin of MazEF toxin-antitoxin module
LILSEDVFNDRSGTVIAIALTSQPQRAGFPLTLELTDSKFRHPDSPGNSMSPPSTENTAFENSTTSREATPTAVETRSEFRYRIEAAAPQ